MAEQSKACDLVSGKVCVTCKEEKQLCEYHKHSRSKDGHKSQCKKCAINAQKKRYSPVKYKEYYEKVKDRKAETKKEWYEKNKEMCAERWKVYYGKNRKQIIKNGQPARTEYQRRLRQDPKYRLIQAMRSKVGQMIKNRSSSIKLLDYSASDLASHLERQFHPGMSWENYGRKGWCVDHIRPVSSFDHGDQDQINECWCLSNLRPIWEKDNMAKTNKSEHLL